MKLYHWTSEYLAEYATGDIIVMAETVEEAREKARATFIEHRYSTDDFISERFERDIAEEPTEGQDVYFIRGSE